MSGRPRILVVDDEEDTLFTINTALQLEGFSVHTAANQSEAQRAAKSYMFHVAMIDINLAGTKNSDRSGFKVIDFIRNLKEGTKCIAISAFREADVPAEAANRHVDHYIMKKSITAPAIYIREIRRLASEFEPNHFGHFKTVAEYIAGPADPRTWETQMVSALRSDIRTFRSLLERAVRNFLPIIPAIGDAASLQLNETKTRLIGGYWSKAIGQGLEIAVYNRNASISDEVQNEIERFYSGSLCVEVSIRNDVERDYFLTSTFDVKKPAGFGR